MLLSVGCEVFTLGQKTPCLVLVKAGPQLFVEVSVSRVESSAIAFGWPVRFGCQTCTRRCPLEFMQPFTSFIATYELTSCYCVCTIAMCVWTDIFFVSYVQNGYVYELTSVFWHPMFSCYVCELISFFVSYVQLLCVRTDIILASYVQLLNV